MSAAAFTANLAAYLLQTTLLLAAGLLLPRLFGMRDPQVRLRYWYALLAFSFVLPFAWLAGRPPAAPAVSFTGRLAGGMEVQVHAGPAPVSPWVWVPVALAAVAAARALWLLGGFLLLERLRRRSRALDPLPEALEEAARTLFVDVDFRVSRSVSTPLTFGWLRPVILLPEAVAGMPLEEQRCVALHELLHVRRRDWLAILLEESLRSLLWFHPALWLVLDRVALSREQSVDLEVVRITEARRTYMSTLSAMARTRYPAAAVAILPFFHRSHLLQRLALLTQEVSMSKVRWRLAAAGSAVVLLLAGAVAARSFPLLHGQSPTSGAAGRSAGAGRYVVAIHSDPGPGPGQVQFIAVVLDDVTNERVMEPHIVTSAGRPASVSAESASGPQFSLRVAFNEGETEATYLFRAFEGDRELQREEGRVALPSTNDHGVFGLEQDGLTKPKLIGEFKPVRPTNVPDISGSVAVVLEFVINPEGVPENIKVMKSGGSELDAATVDMISRCRWEPARLNGEPVSVRVPFTTRWGAGVDAGLQSNDEEPSAAVAPNSAEPPDAAKPENGIYPMGSIPAPTLLKQVNPEYPEQARQKGIGGRVVLETVINQKGEPTQLKVIKSDNDLLNASALAAVGQWRWEGPRLHGKPVSARWNVVINFSATH